MADRHDLNAIAEFFDNCAAKGLMSDFTDEQLAKTKRFLRDWNVQAGDRVLEPGCGSGRLTRLLAEAVGSEGEVLAMDLSAEMVACSRGHGLPEQAEVVRGSVYEVPREAGYFDHVICFCVFPHLTRPAEALAEFARVLKPGGKLWVNHLEGSVSLNRFHTDTESVVSSHHLPSDGEMRRLLKGAGFGIERFEDDAESYGLCAVKL